MRHSPGTPVNNPREGHEVSEDKVVSELLTFIRTEFLDGDAAGELTDETPLLAWGVLDSFKMARLLSFVQDGLGVQVPAAQLSAENFRDIRSIAAVVASSGGQTRAVQPNGAP